MKRIGKKSPNGDRNVILNFLDYHDAIKFKEFLNNDNNNYTAHTYSETFVDKTIEKFHCRFLKYVMGINKYASNVACMGELGRLPLINKARALALRFRGLLHKTSINFNLKLYLRWP